MEWKKTDLLGVESMMATEGTYTGLSQKATNFTPQFLKNCFNRFTGIKPLFLTHNGDRITMGYITSLGFDESDSTIHFKGIVFDEEKKKRVIEEGFDCISPEFELLSGTPEDPIDGQITGGAFTRFPAIPGTEVSKYALAFSAIDDSTQAIVNEETNDMVEQTIATPTTNDATTTSSAPAYSAAEVELAKKQLDEQINSYKNTISTLTTELDTYKSKIESAEQSVASYKEKYETLLGGEVTKIEAELKAMGIETPGEFAKGLDVETRLEVLKSAKANLAKNSTLNAPPAGNIDAKPPAKDRVEAARRMGLDEKYMKFLK